jgi:hypothetical protein
VVATSHFTDLGTNLLEELRAEKLSAIGTGKTSIDGFSKVEAALIESFRSIFEPALRIDYPNPKGSSPAHGNRKQKRGNNLGTTSVSKTVFRAYVSDDSLSESIS